MDVGDDEFEVYGLDTCGSARKVSTINGSKQAQEMKVQLQSGVSFY